MTTRFFLSRGFKFIPVWLCWVVVVGACMQMATVGRAVVAVTISPNVVTNDYVGKITITITGLATGKTVRVEKFADLNTNGVLNAPDVVNLWNSFTVTDGQAPLLAGGTNLNVVGDVDGAANGQISAPLFYPGTDNTLDAFAIKYLIRVSDPAGTFALTNTFEVRQKVYPQGITGKLVTAAGVAITNSVVVLVNQNGPGGFGAAVNSAGNYTIYCAAGSYGFISLNPGYVASVPVTVSSNVIATRNLTNTVAPFTITGKVSDNLSGTGLPGIFVQGHGPGGLFSGGFSDTNGNYSIAVTAGSWQVKPSESEAARLGYMGLQNGVTQNVAASVSGLNFALPKGTALIYGRVTDNYGNPMSGLSMFADDSGNTYEAAGESYAPDGSYAMALKAGEWFPQVDGDNPGLGNYQIQNADVTISAGQAQEVDLVLQYCGAVQITTTNLPSGEVGVNYDVNINAASCNPSFTWSVVSGEPGWATLDPSSGEFYGTPDVPGTNNLIVHVVDGNNHATNQTLSLVITGVAAPLEVDTFSFPNATNGVPYNFQLVADGGSPPYSWSVTPGYGGPQNNLTLNSDGTITGTPTNTGNSFFEVRVTDSAFTTADSTLLSLSVVNPPLQPLVVTNTSLPNGTVGTAYLAQLGATGGQTPYQCWGLALGSASLPPGLTPNCDGSITGTPLSAGTYSFIVQATDFYGTQATKLLSIKVNSAPVLGSPAWLANQFSARLTGVTGQNYTLQYSTTLTNWTALFVTNSATTNSFRVTDPSATSRQRVYRVLVGP